MKIYTKTGDKGETGIIGGRVRKNSIIIDTLGSIDELNASLGVILADIDNAEIKNYLTKIQNLMFHFGAVIAGNKKVKLENLGNEIKDMEQNIDVMEATLPLLQNFILPGGSHLSARIHLSRAIARRVERQYVTFLDNISEEDNIYFEIQKFFNRLSDYLFVLARFVNKAEGVEDVKVTF